MNLLRKAFLPTPEEIQKSEKMLEEIEKQIPITVKLKPDPEKTILMVSEPSQLFKTDCSFCRHYHDESCGMTDGGWCTKHNIKCGWGFTCRDWRGEGGERGNICD